MKRILIIEDDRDIVELVRYNLANEGFQVNAAFDGSTGLTTLKKSPPDLLLLDLMLPKMSGLDICREVRKDESLNRLPVLMLTARGDEADRVVGLEMGADDYVTKPFHKDELVARIHAIVRRSKGHAHSVINTGDLCVNLDTKMVEVNGVPIHLTGKEYQILELLSLRKGAALPKEIFLNHIYGGMDEPEIKIIDVFICKLRKKLADASGGKDYISTIRGRGYVLGKLSQDETLVLV